MCCCERSITKKLLNRLLSKACVLLLGAHVVSMSAWLEVFEKVGAMACGFRYYDVHHRNKQNVDSVVRLVNPVRTSMTCRDFLPVSRGMPTVFALLAEVSQALGSAWAQGHSHRRI